MSSPDNDGNIVKRTSQYVDNVEHDETTGAKGVAIYGTPDGTNVYRLKINADGSISSAATADTSASGTISTRNLNPSSGVATANSTVALTGLNGTSTLTIQTVGTYTGALTVQTSVDGTNWVSLAGTQILNKNTGLFLATITSALQSTFEVDIAGHENVRVSANAAVTGSVVVTLNATAADGNTISTVGTVTAVTTLSTLTNITNWGNIVDNAAFTDGTTRLMPGGYIYDEVAGTALTENDAAAARIDSKRAQVVTLEDATTRGQRLAIGADGAIATAPSRFATTTNTNVAASATSVQLAAANTARKELTIQNDSSSILYIKEGTTASATDYKYKLYQDDIYRTNNYTGRVDGIWSAASGAARVSES